MNIPFDLLVGGDVYILGVGSDCPSKSQVLNRYKHFFIKINEHIL